MMSIWHLFWIVPTSMMLGVVVACMLYAASEKTDENTIHVIDNVNDYSGKRN